MLFLSRVDFVHVAVCFLAIRHGKRILNMDPRMRKLSFVSVASVIICYCFVSNGFVCRNSRVTPMSFCLVYIKEQN
jgi:hypothetical protein